MLYMDAWDWVYGEFVFAALVHVSLYYLSCLRRMLAAGARYTPHGCM